MTFSSAGIDTATTELMGVSDGDSDDVSTTARGVMLASPVVQKSGLSSYK